MNDSADDNFASEAYDVSFVGDPKFEDLEDDGLMETEETKLLGDDTDRDRNRTGS